MKGDCTVGRWELGCIVFNSLAFKLFSVYPKAYFDFGGCASWLTALVSGMIFLILLRLVLSVYEKYADIGISEALKRKIGRGKARVVSMLAVAWFFASFCVSAYCLCDTLREAFFPKSPLWYTVFFVSAASVFCALCGKAAVGRIHSLCTIGVGISIAVILFFNVKNVDLYNLTPILGSGTKNVFFRGIASIAMYSEILVLFFMPGRSEKYSYKNTVMRSAFLAVVVNVLTMLVFSSCFPYEYAERLSFPMYSLAKGAAVGSFPLRIDFIYLTSLIISALLYCSAAFNIVLREIKNVRLNIGKAGAGLMIVLLCITVCGCYDSSEVEEKAYVIAIGIDKGEEYEYNYTFQFANPLKTDKNTETDDSDTETLQSGTADNSTVENVCVEADGFLNAQERLKSAVGKKTDFSNVKIAVLSENIAAENALPHCEALLEEREIRPSVKLCLASSAEGYLKSVSPVFEDNTVRFYEQFFGKNDIPYSTAVTLREFVSKSLDKAFDAVVPLVGEKGLLGTAFFDDGRMWDKNDEEETFVYNLLSGKIKNCAYDIMGEECRISNCGGMKVKVHIENSTPYIDVDLHIVISGEKSDTAVRRLKNRVESLLYKTAENESDIFGIGRVVKSRFLYQYEWDLCEWDNLYKKSVFSVNFIENNGK